MADMALPINIDTSNADSGSDPTVQAHQQHHDALHGLYNLFDLTTTRVDNQTLIWNNTTKLWVPAALNTALGTASVPYTVISNFSAGMSNSSNVGAFLNVMGWPVYIYIDASTGIWPNSGARTVPTGFTGRVIWDSQAYVGAPSPSSSIDGDVWDIKAS